MFGGISGPRTGREHGSEEQTQDPPPKPRTDSILLDMVERGRAQNGGHLPKLSSLGLLLWGEDGHAVSAATEQ